MTAVHETLHVRLLVGAASGNQRLLPGLVLVQQRQMDERFHVIRVQLHSALQALLCISNLGGLECKAASRTAVGGVENN